VTWSAELAYALGLMATDGNLSGDGRHMSFISRDRELVDTLRRCLGLGARACPVRTSRGGILYRVQWSRRTHYDWFQMVGLMPAKSRRLDALGVPDAYFVDFFRGCIDGDGTVLCYTDRYHAHKKAEYVYERLYVSLVTASEPFAEWVQRTVERLIGVGGAIHCEPKRGHRPVWRLRYAKASSIRILRWMYHSPDVPCLGRKRATAEKFLIPLGTLAARRVGRPRVGWLYNGEAARPGWQEAACRGGEMADSRRSKRRTRKGVRVQVPPPVPPSLTRGADGR
jgi:hypothetical protein